MLPGSSSGFVIRSSPVKKPRGGRRPNAGRPKLTTPVKKALYQSKVLKQGVSRAKVRAKFNKVVAQLGRLRESGQKRSAEYQALALEYVKLSKWLNVSKRHREPIPLEGTPPGGPSETVHMEEDSDPEEV